VFSAECLIALPVPIDSVPCDTYEMFEEEHVARWDWEAWLKNGGRAEGGCECSSLNGTSTSDYRWLRKKVNFMTWMLEFAYRTSHR
jgi:hypothetical protein